MNSIAASSRAFPGPGFAAGLRRLALVVLCLALVACGGRADAPPPETVPSVLGQPADASVVAGSAARFSVDAAGAAPLAYQWSSSTDGTTFTEIAGATESSFGTGPTTEGQSGTFYRVVVSNSLGSVTSSAARLTVTPAPITPAIAVQPADQTVTATATATFSVTATGTTLAYQWQSSADAGATFAALPGAPDAPTLTLTNTTVAQSGLRYRVRVSNGAGSVTSDSALLTVNAAPAAPSFTIQPAAQSIVAGATAAFTVAAAGSPAPTLRWRLGGVALADGAQASGACAGAVASGAGGPTLTLSAVPIGCSGAVFSAVASNGVAPDATSGEAILTVNAAASAPSITQQPGDLSVLAGATATFSAAAAGVPSPTVQWQLSSDGGSTWANIVAATNASYTTPATVVADSGRRFRAVFSNGSGTATSNGALLTVTAPMTAMFSSPHGAAIDPAGNLYVADTANHTIRKITAGGVVSTLAGLAGNPGSADGTGSAARFEVPRGIAVDAAGNVYVADTNNDTIRRITPAGDVTTLAGSPGSSGSADGTGSAARFNRPWAIAIDGSGTLHVADSSSHTIRAVTAAGVVSTPAGLAGSAGSADGTGSAARFNLPKGVAVDAAGNVYVVELNHTVRKMAPGGVVGTLAGLAGSAGSADGAGSAARFADPQGVAVDAAGNVYVSDTANRTVRRVTPAGDTSTLAGQAGSSGNVDGSGSVARFGRPRGMSIDATGNLYVADTDNESVRKVTPAGVVTTVAQ